MTLHTLPISNSRVSFRKYDGGEGGAKCNIEKL